MSSILLYFGIAILFILFIIFIVWYRPVKFNKGLGDIFDTPSDTVTVFCQECGCDTGYELLGQNGLAECANCSHLCEIVDIY